MVTPPNIAPDRTDLFKRVSGSLHIAHNARVKGRVAASSSIGCSPPEAVRHAVRHQRHKDPTGHLTCDEDGNYANRHITVSRWSAPVHLSPTAWPGNLSFTRGRVDGENSSALMY